MNEKRLKEIAKELKVIDKEVDNNYKKLAEVHKEAEDLKKREMKLRSEMLFLKKTLSQKRWTYDSGDCFSGRYDDYFKKDNILGRLDDYHTTIKLEEFVELCISDGDVYLRFSSSSSIRDVSLVKEKMRSFIKRWEISLDTTRLMAKSRRFSSELEQVTLVLEQVKEMQK